MWACKIDLKHAYFHLGLSEGLKPFIRMNVGERIFQFKAACFGLNTLPQQWQSVMKVFQKLWRKGGILCFIYLEDTLVLGTTPHQVSHSITYILQTLEHAGMVINHPKSILEPCQEVVHLGFLLHL